MSYKPVQLALATELGFAIPDTVVTNDADDVLELFKRNPRMIYKTLSSFLIPPDEMIFTNEVTQAQVLDGAGAIGLAPGIFQELVEKKYELRVTIVNDSVFAVRIESQKFPENSIDWRRNQLAEMYVPTVLRLEDEQRLRALHSRMGLVYAAYDFVVDQKDELVFLECNPGGQWLWLEHALDLPISHTLAETLRRRDLIAARV
jgi:glutathione synthase/RimK-type ligase-like ATP-grasp enzyme